MTLREYYLQRAKAEFPVFVKVMKALPDDLSYKPHERSPSAEQIVWLLMTEMKACIDAVDTGQADWIDDVTPPSRSEMIALYEKYANELIEKVSNVDDAALEKNAKFIYKGMKVMDEPGIQLLWELLFDAINKRGQLSAYIRPMGGKVPSIYGQSADDKGI